MASRTITFSLNTDRMIEAVKASLQPQIEELAARTEKAEAAILSTVNILGNADNHPTPLECLGRMMRPDSPCPICRAQAALLKALDEATG